MKNLKDKIYLLILHKTDCNFRLMVNHKFLNHINDEFFDHINNKIWWELYGEIDILIT